VRAGPNGADRVLVDKERRIMETLSLIIDYLLMIIFFVVLRTLVVDKDRRLTDIFPKFDGICPLFSIAGRRICWCIVNGW